MAIAGVGLSSCVRHEGASPFVQYNSLVRVKRTVTVADFSLPDLKIFVVNQCRHQCQPPRVNCHLTKTRVLFATVIQDSKPKETDSLHFFEFYVATDENMPLLLISNEA